MLTQDDEIDHKKKHKRDKIETKTLNQDVQDRLCLYYTVFALVGLVTNTGFVMVGSAAEDLAVTFGKETFMPMFQLSEILFASLIQFINSWLLIKIKHIHRLTFNAFYMLSAYLLITAVTIWQFEAGFYIALVAALMHGTSAAFSESTVLGFMKGFPSRLVAPFSTGTGFAGVFGSGILLFLKLWFDRDGYIFAIVSPIILVYLFCIFWLQKQKTQFRFDQAQDALSSTNKRSLGNDTVDPFLSPLSKSLSSDMKSGNLTERQKALEGDAESDEIVLEYEAPENEELEEEHRLKIGQNTNIQEPPDNENIDEAAENEAFSFSAFKRVVRHVGVYLFSLSIIYFFEYTILTCFADVYTKRKRVEEGNDIEYLKENSYIILTVCYQFGVLVSRGSLDFFKIKKLWILILLQIFNFVLWFLNVYYFEVTNYAVVFCHIALVGMMGGTLYVNVLYNIVSSRTLDYNDKELAMIMCTIFDDLGILTASCASLALDNTIFKEYQQLEGGEKLMAHFMLRASRRM